MESFSPQERRVPFPFSVRLREGASPQPRWGAMAALRLGAPFTTMGIGEYFVRRSLYLKTSLTRSNL